MSLNFDIGESGYLRLPRVIDLCGLKRSAIYDLIQQNRFPAPVKLTERSSGWRVRDIKAWLDGPLQWQPSAQQSDVIELSEPRDY